MEQTDLLTQYIIGKTVVKGTILQREGDERIRAFLVKKGLLRSYKVDSHGKEHVFMFAPEGWLITDVELFGHNGKAMLYIDALENSEIDIIDEKIFKSTSQFSAAILTDQINKLINRVNTLQKRVLSLMSSTAEERYREFISTYPQIVQRVPQKMIASYLGITPQALSNIRRKK